MDQAIRNKLRGVVTQCRRLLEDSVSQELQGKFGIYAAKKDAVQVDGDARMTHLSPEGRAARKDILDHFEHIKARGLKPKEALDQLVREIAYTHLNRFCAYKMMEARQVYVGDQKFREAVSRGVNSNGVKFYLADHPDDLRLFETGKQDVAYRHFLDWLGGLLSEEIGVLFNPNDSANRLYPTQKVLDEVLALLNDDALAEIWTQDETIGWVYQYFTPKELRDQARKESAAPRNAYELAFRNQFFTSWYVVEFLIDNTLGRIWYEMRKGDTNLKEQCRYMVRRPDEVFLGVYEVTPQCVETDWQFLQGEVDDIPAFLLSGGRSEVPNGLDGSALGVQEKNRLTDFASHVSIAEKEIRERQAPWAEFLEQLNTGSVFGRVEGTTQELWNALAWVCGHHPLGPGRQDLWPIAASRIANEIRRRLLVGRKENASQKELLRSAVLLSARPKKDPRDLKILDPACGSGHFLLYCFDLLLTIYEEAYDDPDLGPALKEDYPALADLKKAVSGLILSCNLHGIDIDLRANQIAALALWLRCQRAYQDMGLKKDRPKITRSNFVCAEPMPGEKGLLDEFLKTLHEDRLEALIQRVMQVPEGRRVRATRSMADSLCELVRLVWDKMQLAGEAGSLLKIEEELQGAIRKGQEEWEEMQPLFRITEFSLREEPKETYVRFVPGEGVSFWERAEALVMEALHDFATFAANGRRLQRRLFTEDAVRGFAFVDICPKRFDAVLMNPPFGEMPEQLLAYLSNHYPQTKYDLAPAFVERALQWLHQGGRIGWIAPRTWFALSLLAPFRKEQLYSHSALDSVLDLGIGVLDTALVEVACCTAQGGGRIDSNIFTARLLASRDTERDVAEVGYCNPPPHQLVSTRLVENLPRSAFGYWFPPVFAKHLQAVPQFDANGGEARQGLATTDDFRFVRCLWEVPPSLVGFYKRWVPFAKGGEYEPYYEDLHLVIDYADDGHVLKEYLVREKGQKHWSRRIASSEYYGQIGLTYPERTTSDLSLRPLPEGAIFSATGQAVFSADRLPPLCFLGLSYTRLFKQILELYVGGGDASESGSAARDYTSGILNEMKVPKFGTQDKDQVEPLVNEAVALRRAKFQSVEETCDFVVPRALANGPQESLSQVIAKSQRAYRAEVRRLLEIGHALDEWACDLYQLPEEDGKAFLSEEVCQIPLSYPKHNVPDEVQRELSVCSISQLVKLVFNSALLVLGAEPAFLPCFCGVRRGTRKT